MSASAAVELATPPGLHLDDGSRVAVVGSGPAGSLFAYFLLEMAERVDVHLAVDVYEPRVFAVPGPAGCNMCGGIVSETLVQNLAIEGVELPPGVVQRGIDSYVLHTDVGSARIITPAAEARIGALHRGAGPKGATEARWKSFDHYLQSKAIARGARPVKARVEKVSLVDGRPRIQTKDGTAATYDLLVVATGVNSPVLKVFEELGIGFERPKVTKTLIREYRLGEDVINRSLGTSMHVFLLDIPRLEFAAAIPKGDYVTICLLGEDIDDALVQAFLASPEVRGCMPPEWDPEAKACQCIPAINVRGAMKPYADRFVFIGDAGVTRLYKDGIGAAYRTAKAAARAALFEGISEEAFRRWYRPVCRKIARDNRVGRVAFLATRLARRFRALRGGMLQMTISEQGRPGSPQRMSGVLWDMFSGSAPYSDIFVRMLRPSFLGRFVWAVLAYPWRRGRNPRAEVVR